MDFRENLPRLQTQPRVKAEPVHAMPQTRASQDYFADVLDTDGFNELSEPQAEYSARYRSAERTGMELVPVQVPLRERSQMVRTRSPRAAEGNPRTRGSSNRAVAEQPTSNWMQKLVWQCTICAVILLTVLIFRQLDVPILREAVEGVRVAVTEPTDIDDTLGQLKYVQNWFPETAAVFFGGVPRESLSLSPPVSGRIIQGFESGRSTGIEVDAGAGAAVYAAAEGTVLDIGPSTQWGQYLRIDHGNGTVSVYGNIAQDQGIDAGMAVSAGQNIGTVGSDGILHYELQVEGYAVDPLPHLQTIPLSGANQ